MLTADNMTVDGNCFSGGEVNLYLNDNPVDLTGANSETESAGLFAGPLDVALDVPEDFVAVGVVERDDDALWFSAVGAAAASTDIVQAEWPHITSCFALFGWLGILMSWAGWAMINLHVHKYELGKQLL